MTTPRRSSNFLLLVLVMTVAAHAQSGDWRRDIELARSRIYPALVNISVLAKDYDGGRTVRYSSAGSGTVVSPAGHVLTNHHVTEGALRIVCTLPTGEQIPADVVGHDPATDLCVLRMKLAERADADVPIPFVTLGDSDELEVGDQVIAVGNPLSLSSSMTMGIVSNTKRVFTDFRGNEIEDLEVGSGNKTGMFTRWIQHDALILPGNSGGPLCNLRGEIVGVNTRGGEGYGFATPSNLARRVLNQILTFGEVRRGWIGVSFIPVDKLGRKRGALVGSVAQPSPAAKAGLAPGDVLLAIDGGDVLCRFVEEIPLLYGRIADLRPGSEVPIAFERKGARHEVRVAIAAMEDFVGDRTEVRELGITVQLITAPMALARQYPDTNGVLVTGVRPGQPFEAAKPDIRPGDVVLSVGGRAVSDLAGFRAAVKEGLQSREVPVSFRRDRELWITVIELDKSKPDKPGGELPRAWLGVLTQVLTPKVAAALGIAGREGFRITEVYPWTRAAEAGLLAGDVITAIDGEPLGASRAQDAKDLKNRIEELEIGDEVAVSVVREGQELSLDVELEETPASSLDAKKSESEVFEFKVRDITFMDKIESRWTKEQTGVWVLSVTGGGWASVAGLRPGDLVCSMNGIDTADVKSFDAALETLRRDQPKVVPLFLRRGHRTTFVFMEPDWTSPEVGEGR